MSVSISIAGRRGDLLDANTDDLARAVAEWERGPRAFGDVLRARALLSQIKTVRPSFVGILGETRAALVEMLV